LSTKYKKVKKEHKHALIFLTIVCCILLGATASITYMILKSADKELELQVERDLLTQAYNKVATVSTWYGKLTNQVGIISNSDFLRLFTYESTQYFSDYADMIKIAEQAKIEKINSFEQLEKNPFKFPNEYKFNLQIYEKSEHEINLEAKAELAQQLLILNKNLKHYIEQNNFLSASVYNIEHKLFASANAEKAKLSDMQKMLMANALKQNAFVISNAYHVENMLMSMDVVQPIFPPAYMAEDGIKIIGFLLITIDASPTIDYIVGNESTANGARYWIIQKDENKLVQLSVENKNQLIMSNEWKIDSNNQIPFGIRLLDNGVPNYSLGLNVPNLPWHVVADIPVSTAANILYSSTNIILLVIGIVVIIVLLLITFAWWWLVGQEERKSKAKIISLYDTIEKQKSLLENVNSNLHDGIVMRDIAGVILYANDAFAKMMQDKVENIIGSNFKNIFMGKTNMPINPYIVEVIKNNKPITYTEMIETQDGIHHFQVTYAPYIINENETSGIVGIYNNITDLLTTQNSHKLMSLHLITVLKRTIEAFDPYLKGHSTHVGKLATTLAYMHGLNNEQVSVINAAANLSQIGVIQLPHKLRSKTSVYSIEERLLLETHIELAKKILDDIEFGLPIQNVIYQMYENLDGTGYPQKLKGNDICIESRVLSIANTFCAIMRPRAHRQAKDVAQALNILSTSNPAYDKDIVTYLHTWIKGHEGIDFVKRLEKE